VLITLTTTVTAIHHKPSTLAAHHLGALVLSGPSDRPSIGCAHERNGRGPGVNFDEIRSGWDGHLPEGRTTSVPARAGVLTSHQSCDRVRRLVSQPGKSGITRSAGC
jgi:hypothetical protein